MKHPALKYLVAALLTLGLLYLAFRGQNLGEALAAMRSAHFLPLFGGLVLMFLSHAVRALRWQIVLRPLKRQTSFGRAYAATLAGYGMNNVIPRSGELVRPYLMARGEGVPMPGVLASVVVERLTDVLALAVLLAFSLLSFHDQLIATFPMLSGGTIPVLLVMLGVLFVFVGAFFSETRTLVLVRILFKPLPDSVGARLEKMALNFSQGLRGLDKRALLPLLAGSVGIWLLYGLSMYISLKGFSEPAMSAIPVSGAFLLLTLSGISFTIPTPGGSGTYHFFISQGLSHIFGVPMEVALGYAILTHALSYISITAIGLGILIKEGLSFGKMQELSQTSAPVVEPQLQAQTEQLPSAVG